VIGRCVELAGGRIVRHVTSSNHLARALVSTGDVVARGEPIALAGASGLDLFTFFPWLCPHVHFNVFLDGRHVDPFSIGPDEPSMWRGANGMPVPDDGAGGDAALDPADWDHDGVDRAIESCLHDETRRTLGAIGDAEQRAMTVLFHTAYFPTRFAARPQLYARAHARRPWLDLPFSRDQFAGVALPESS